MESELELDDTVTSQSIFLISLQLKYPSPFRPIRTHFGIPASPKGGLM
jgi:hypothetical protein